MSAEELRQGDVARFTPEARSRRVTVLVEDVTELSAGSPLVFVHGRRCTAEGVIDSQAQRRAWPVRRAADAEVLA